MSQERPVLPAAPPRWDLDFEALARDLRPLGNATRVRLLNYLTLPRYLEEVASFLKVNRYAAKKHLDQLLARGFIAKAPVQRPQGLVVEYRVVQEKLFEIFDATRSLGTLRPVAGGPERASQTKPMAPTELRAGPGDEMPRLLVVYGVDLGLAMQLPSTGGTMVHVLGRDQECDLRVMSDPFVSGRHARIERQGSLCQVTDLHSRNGTFVDWKRVPPGQTQRLENGQVLGVGKTLLLFRTR